ncbi:hypothetical protein D9M70_247260 [compost metagenome]
MHAATIHADLGQQRAGQGAADREDQHRVAQAVEGHLVLPGGQRALGGEQVHRPPGVLKAHVAGADDAGGQHEHTGLMPARFRSGGDDPFRLMVARQVWRQVPALVVLDVQPLAHQGAHHFIALAGQQFHRHYPLQAAAAVLEAQQAADAAVFTVHRLGFHMQGRADPVIDGHWLFIWAAVLHRVVPGAGAVELAFDRRVPVVHGEARALELVRRWRRRLANQAQVSLHALGDAHTGISLC